MNVVWLLVAPILSLMVQSIASNITAAQSARNSTYHQAPDPRAPSEDYRRAVAASIQDLVSGRRPRDEAVSGMSTTRLIIEGVVENLRIYRLHRQEMERKARAKEGRSKERGPKVHHKTSHRGGGGRHRPSNHGHREGEEVEQDQGERRHRRRHRIDDGERGHRQRRQHRSADGTGEQQRRRRPRKKSTEAHGNRDLEGQTHQETRPEQRARFPPRVRAVRSRSDFTMSGALPVAKPLLGPDGTLFGSIPMRGAGVGFFSHAQDVYKHFKAEQHAGQRSKGLVEKHIDTFLQKRRDARGAQEGGQEEPLIEATRGGGERRRGERRRRRRRRSGSREAERQSRGSEVPVLVPVDGVSRPSAAWHRDRQFASSEQQIMPSGQEARPLMQPTNQSIHGAHAEGSTSAFEREGEESKESTGAFGRPLVVDNGSPAPEPSARSDRASRPTIRSTGSDGDNQAASRAPSIQIQSPTPPKEGRLSTSLAHEDLSRHQISEPELPNSVAPAGIAAPCPSVHDSSPVPKPPATPLPPPPVARSPAESHRNAFLASIQTGVKLKKVRSEDMGDVNKEHSTYEETLHSHDVEAREYAQAVEERERKQEKERVARAKTPLTAPQPRTKMPANFQDELAARVEKMRLGQQGDDEAAGTEPGGVKPRASNGSWRTMFKEHEEQNRMPDRQFRQMLGDTLSRPSTGMTRPQEAGYVVVVDKTLTKAANAAQSREETPAPYVFVNLSANVAGPDWQSGPSWGFSSVPEDVNAEPRDDRT